MSELKASGCAYRVDIIERERGWGSKVDEIKYFDNEAEAVNFVKSFNARNTALVAPDWYMQAEYVGKTAILVKD